MGEAVAKAVNGRVTKADRRSPTGATGEAMRKLMMPPLEAKSVIPPIRPITVVIGLRGVSWHDAARTRVI
jgi:hypothetical protein